MRTFLSNVTTYFKWFSEAKKVGAVLGTAGVTTVITDLEAGHTAAAATALTGVIASIAAYIARNDPSTPVTTPPPADGPEGSLMAEPQA